jgi:hypothetical protein
MDNKILPFENKKVRSLWHNNEWMFSIVDIIEVLTDATQPRTYWAKLKKKIKDESQLLPIWQQLKLMSDDGKKYKTDCANTEGGHRIVMSVPSPKAEPFKLWLAKVGQEYSILTAEIAKGTFGLTLTKHKELKGLDKQNLRDHMTPLKLIFTALGEEVTCRLAIENDAQGFDENRE